jgi:hypothetical protein
MTDGSIDLEELSNACFVGDIENPEWFEALSQEDKDTIEDIIFPTTIEDILSML